MKHLVLLLVLGITTPVFADVYVITSPDKSVYSLSSQDDAVVPVGYTKDVIKDKDIASLQLGDDTSLYNFNGKKFILDDKKVGKKNKDLQDMAVAREAKKQAKQTAQDKLKALGLTEAEVNSLIGSN
jgi:hypothetical protein